MKGSGLPQYWRLEKIENLCMPVESVDFNQRESTDFYYVDISSIDNNQKTIVATDEITNAEAPNRARQVIAAKDVLVSTARPNLNTVAIVSEELDGEICSTNFCVLRAIQEILEPEYLFAWVRHTYFIQSLIRRQRGAGYPTVSDSDVKSVSIPLPPLLEQRRIIEILREADELRRLRRESNDKAKHLITALFLETFGTPLDWKETVPLKKIVDFVSGGTPNRKVKRFFTGDIPWATSKDIEFRYLNTAQEHITEEAIEESATNLVPARTILLVMKSKLLMHSLPMGITTKPFCFGQDVKGLICKPGIEPEFVVAALDAQANLIVSRAQRVNTEILSLEIIRDIPILNIPLTDQQEFLEKVNVYNQVEQDWQDSGRKFDSLFQSLLVQAFSGELTATWREQNEQNIIAGILQQRLDTEAAQGLFPPKDLPHQMKPNEPLFPMIGEPGGSIGAEESYGPLSANIDEAPTQYKFVSSLSSVQLKVLEAVANESEYFTAWSLLESNPDLSKVENLDAIKVRNALHVLAAAGLIMPVDLLADTSEMEPFYFPAFRVLRPDDDAMADLSFLQGSM